MNEQNYIRWRKLKAFGNRLCFYLCRVFPIKKNRVCVSTFEGKGGFGCNPKYVVQELHRRHPDWEFVWMVRDMGKKFPDYIRKVPYTNFGRAYYMSTSKIWLDNYRTHYGTVKRKGQIYLNTNHYTESIKCTGLWRGNGFSRMAYLVSHADSLQMDGLVIDSAWCEKFMPRAMLFSGELVKSGAPRTDILYGDRREARQSFRGRHGLPVDAHIVMYAPTFREGAKNGKRSVYSETWTLDFARLLQNLEKKFGGNWYLCLRVHPQLAPTFRGIDAGPLQGRVIDESQADDMYEVLAGMDAYITDYSSAVFEAALMKIPTFLYADDTEQYTHDRGALYWDLVHSDRHHIRANPAIMPDCGTELPVPLARSNEELQEDISAFDVVAFAKRVDAFQREFAIRFDGQASCRTADWIERKQSGTDKA